MAVSGRGYLHYLTESWMWVASFHGLGFWTAWKWESELNIGILMNVILCFLIVEVMLPPPQPPSHLSHPRDFPAVKDCALKLWVLLSGLLSQPCAVTVFVTGNHLSHKMTSCMYWEQNPVVSQWWSWVKKISPKHRKCKSSAPPDLSYQKYEDVSDWGR